MKRKTTRPKYRQRGIEGCNANVTTAQLQHTSHKPNATNAASSKRYFHPRPDPANAQKPFALSGKNEKKVSIIIPLGIKIKQKRIV
jgi:hypothetical protein